MKNKKKLVLFLVISVMIVLGLRAWDDEKLFTTINSAKGKSNVILIQDRTGSMCSIIYHPDFNPKIALTSYSTVTLPNATTYAGISQTSWYIRWVNGTTIQDNSGGITIKSWTALTNTLVLSSGSTDTKIKNGDWILQYNNSDANNINYQMVAKVAATPTTSGSGSNKVTNLILDPTTIKGTPLANRYVYYYASNSSSYTTKIVKLYGSTLDQGDYNVAYTMDPDLYYLKWIFGVANDTQRQQVTDFSTLAYDVEYNGYIRTTPVRPDLAYALKPDNTNTSTTLLNEWNSVMKSIYPNQIANLKNPATAAATTIIYEKQKDSLAGYPTSGFKIKIDAETMLVSNNVLDAGGEWGTLTVTRGQDNTVAATHPAGAAIMIYNNVGLGIDEYTPLTSLFSSMQHVTEATGDVDPAFTESKTWILNGNNTTRTGCYRYKRVFTRIQMAREALCDVITAKNKLLKVADLAAGADGATTSLTYCNANPDFLTKIPPFYIKVSDPANPSHDEIMKVTAHNSATYTLTVSRGQQGTTACTHNVYSAVMTYSGPRDLVRFGVFYFPDTDPQGGVTSKLLVGLNDFGQKNTDGTYKTVSSINLAILDKVDALDASGSTPLAKALTQVWNYLKPNPGTGTADYIKTGSSSDWKAVDSSTFGTAEKFETINSVTHPKGSPMEYWCQENFAVIITDGDATADNDLTSSYYGVFSQAITKTSAADFISDFFKFDYNRSTANGGPTPWGDTVNDGSEYLTDVAYFLYHQDMFPTTKIKNGTIHWNTTNKYYDTYDPTTNPAADATLYDETNTTDPYKQWPQNQNIKTYTVGLCIANTVLPKAALNGGGANFTASSYRDLTDAFFNIITSVELAQDPMTYTTYAAPKQSITGGNYGYIAHFIPRERAMWEGHLRRFLLSYNGDFPVDIDNPTSTVKVKSGNDISDVVSFQWDASTILENRTAAGVPSDRIVYTSKPNGVNWVLKNFMLDSDISATDLTVTSGQLTQVKKFIQNFSNVDNSRVYPITANQPALLGETFHFNPQLVGYPLQWKGAFDPSYKSFYEKYAGVITPSDARKEVVYTGANDGKLHCFLVNTEGALKGGTELWSYVPFELLTSLKEPALNPLLVTSHTYFVDGKSLVMDIKIGSTGTYTDWKTGLFFGLGIGGRAYCALDVTNPTALKILWETTDSAVTATNGCMGFTEAKPVVVDMYAGSTLGKFPAAILAGGYNADEVRATDITAQDWQRREGKALYILNANTGAVVKKFIYGTANSTSTTLNVNKDFLTAMTAAPAVLDTNNDGIADVIYMAESGDYRVTNDPNQDHGGAIWKINCYGDPANWKEQKIYQAPAGTSIFVSPSVAYDKDYRVWVMFGTGRRPRPVEGSEGGIFTNKTGQFVTFIDNNSSTTITNTNLYDANTAISTSGTTDFTINISGTVKNGFFFDFKLANEIMFEPQPLYINEWVYFMTLAPEVGKGSSGSTADPCGGTSAVNGKHYLYQFKLTSQGNTFTIGQFSNQSSKILGYGPLGNQFIIYKGAGDAGDFKPIGGGTHIELKQNFGTMLWKENKK